MELKTKFNLKEKVWTLSEEGSICEKTIVKIQMMSEIGMEETGEFKTVELPEKKQIPIVKEVEKVNVGYVLMEEIEDKTKKNNPISRPERFCFETESEVTEGCERIEYLRFKV